MYRKIGHCLQPNTDNKKGLSRVDIPADNPLPYPDGPDHKIWTGAWTTVTNPESIVRHACAANTRQYNQASTTPFAQEPLLSYIGSTANMPGAHDILQGSMPPDDLLHLLQPETAQLLKTISTRANYHQHPAEPNNCIVKQSSATVGTLALCHRGGHFVLKRASGISYLGHGPKLALLTWLLLL
jgi:hypothetical protein